MIGARLRRVKLRPAFVPARRGRGAAFKRVARRSGSRRRCLDAIFLGHRSQTLDLPGVQAQALGDAPAVIGVGLEKQGRLAELDALLRIAQVGDNVADQVLTIRVGHDASIEFAGLEEVVVGNFLGMPCGRAFQIDGRLGEGGVGLVLRSEAALRHFAE